MNIFLIDSGGSGKTEAGRRLSVILNRRWLDMDDERVRELSARGGFCDGHRRFLRS